jgi:hypothetical protein
MAPPALVKAVEAAIVASAHVTAYEHLAGANRAVERLGSLSSGRWRAAARDLQQLEHDLHTSLSDVTRDVAAHAERLGLDEEALWAAGDAAATLDLLREPALELLESDSAAARLLTGEFVFGLAVMANPEASDRGTTLVFAWAEPLAPGSWPWQASWITSSMGEDGEAEELDLYDAGEPLLDGAAAQLKTGRADAHAAVRTAAAAVTRASLLLASGAVDEFDGDEDGADTLSL